MAHVVVVEDDRTNAKLIEAILRRRGSFDVTITENVAEVLRLARAHLVDLILLDVSLGRCEHEGKAVDGISITRMIKDNPETADIPVILATAHAMEGDRERFLQQSKADDYLAKPIVVQGELVKKVNDFIRKREEEVNARGASLREGGGEGTNVVDAERPAPKDQPIEER